MRSWTRATLVALALFVACSDDPTGIEECFPEILRSVAVVSGGLAVTYADGTTVVLDFAQLDLACDPSSTCPASTSVLTLPSVSCASPDDCFGDRTAATCEFPFTTDSGTGNATLVVTTDGRFELAVTTTPPEDAEARISGRATPDGIDGTWSVRLAACACAGDGTFAVAR